MATTPVIRQTPQDSTSKREALSVRDALHAKVAAYGKLEPNYNGDNEQPPEQNDVGNMLSFIDHIPDSAIDRAEPYIADDGEIGFSWRKHGHYCLTIIFMDGEMSFGGEMDGKVIQDDVDYDENAVPDELKQFLSDLYAG